jgi:hypothetical protein
VLDPANTKNAYAMLNYGDAIFEHGGFEQIASEPIAKQINSNEVVIADASLYAGNGKNYGVAKVFNLTTKQFGSLQQCTFKVGSTTWDMNSDNVSAVLTATGAENYPLTNDIAFTFQTPIKIGELFYLVMDIGNYSHVLVKTQNLIDYEFVCDIPLGLPSEECMCCYFNNRIYVTSRGNYGRFSNFEYEGFSNITYCNFDDILNGTPNWATPISLEPCCLERPAIFAYNNKIFVWQGTQPNYKAVEGKNMTRYYHQLIIFDRDLNILKRELLMPDDGCIHPMFQVLGNGVYAVNFTDVRNLAYFGRGDNRSELRLIRMDMQLLEM